jgi:hypothetical protein
MKRTSTLVLAVAAAGILATAGSATPRSGALHVTKECSEYTGAAGSFCTITSSNIPQIKLGMQVVYRQALSGLVLNSDVVLSSGHGSAAAGHVVLDLVTRQGRVTFAGGTGKFAGFEADVLVSEAGGVWHWDGTYSFTPPADD